jgi:hypothetical protein
MTPELREQEERLRATVESRRSYLLRECASMTPAFTISSLYLPIAASNSVLGRVSLIKAPSLLAGVLVDARDERVTPSHAVKRADAIATTSPEP